MTHGGDKEQLEASDKIYNLSQTMIHPIVENNKTLVKKHKIFVIQV